MSDPISPPGAPHARGAGALARGEPLAALNAVAGRDDAHALAIRAIALAQLGEHGDARRLLEQVERAFAEGDQPAFRARARAALAELSAAERDLGTALAELEESARELADAGDGVNAAWLKLVRARLLVLLGDVPRARRLIDEVRALADEGDQGGGALVRAAAELALAEACARELRAADALAALDRAEGWTRRAGLALLFREIDAQRAGLGRELARIEHRGEVRAATARDVEALLGDGDTPRRVVLDALRRRLIAPGGAVLDLARRGVPFDLLFELARAWPEPADAGSLVRALFAWDEPDESHLARLKTELARLRALLARADAPVAIEAEGGAWRLAPEGDAEVSLLTPLGEDRASLLEALLWDGAAWSARALAAAADRPLRSVQRELGALVDAGRVSALGGSRSMRYARLDPALGFAPQMFLVGISGWP
ncbi:MAG: helix-turn-helix domain-containing protein [Planctomycetota bacterium]